MVDREGRKVCVGGGKEAGGKERGGREERSGAAGNHRYVQDGGWVAWREDREKYGILEERRNQRGNVLVAPLWTELLVEIPELTNVKHLKVRLLGGRQYKTVLVRANENKER